MPRTTSFAAVVITLLLDHAPTGGAAPDEAGEAPRAMAKAGKALLVSAPQPDE